jgi:hypothetical protein
LVNKKETFFLVGYQYPSGTTDAVIINITGCSPFTAFQRFGLEDRWGYVWLVLHLNLTVAVYGVLNFILKAKNAAGDTHYKYHKPGYKSEPAMDE